MSDFGRVSADEACEFKLGESQTGTVSRRPTSSPLSLFALLLAFMVLMMSIGTLEHYSEVSAIQRHGESVEVKVTEIYSLTHHGYRTDICNIYGDLLFTPRGWDHPLKLKTHLWTPLRLQAVFVRFWHLVGCCHLSGL